MGGDCCHVITAGAAADGMSESDFVGRTKADEDDLTAEWRRSGRRSDGAGGGGGVTESAAAAAAATSMSSAAAVAMARAAGAMATGTGTGGSHAQLRAHGSQTLRGTLGLLAHAWLLNEMRPSGACPRLARPEERGGQQRDRLATGRDDCGVPEALRPRGYGALGRRLVAVLHLQTGTNRDTAVSI